jgi:hypothetical protein
MTQKHEQLFHKPVLELNFSTINGLGQQKPACTVLYTILHKLLEYCIAKWKNMAILKHHWFWQLSVFPTLP